MVVHIHDNFWPFEYPEEWLIEGRSFNEQYLLRAMLAASFRYAILHFGSYLFLPQRASLACYPDWATHYRGVSIWLLVR